MIREFLCCLVHPFGKKTIPTSNLQRHTTDCEDSEQLAKTFHMCLPTNINFGIQMVFQLVSETEVSIVQILASPDVTTGEIYYQF